MKTKLLTSLLFVMVIVCAFVICTSAATVTISTPEELLTLMNEGYTMSDTFVLAGNIDLSQTEGQTPIGTSGKKFTGTFDGKGYTISGINITSSTDASYPYIGLFGLAQGATIKNLTVEGTVSGASYVGGIVAWCRGATIINCTNKVNVTTSGANAGGILGYGDYNLTTGATLTISGCKNEGTVTATGTGAGGIYGCASLNGNNGKTYIQNCVNEGAVSASGRAGGILGITGTTAKTGTVIEITGCKNYGAITITTGNVVGGIMGYYMGRATSGDNIFKIHQCENYGTIAANSQTSGQGGYVGGILGAALETGNKYALDITLTELYNNGKLIRGTSQPIGAIVSYLRIPLTETVDGKQIASLTMSDWVNDCDWKGDTTSWMIYTIPDAGIVSYFGMTNIVNNAGSRIFSVDSDLSGELVVGTNNHVNFANCISTNSTAAEKAAFVAANSDKYMMDGDNVSLRSTLTLDTKIGSAEEMALLMATPSAWDKAYTLECDIDISGIAQSPIGNSTTPFTGSFDGKNHAITGLNISVTTTGGGLFGYTKDATIQNLTVSGSVTATTSTGSRAGGLIGEAQGDLTVSGCTINVTVNAEAGAAGGVVGTVNSGVEKGTVSISNTTSTGNVTGSKYNAGFIGYALGAYDTTITLTNCKNTGNITSSDSGSATGGIVGYLIPSNAVTYTFKNCENTGAISGYNYNGGILALVGSPSAAANRSNFNFVFDGCINRGSVTTTAGNVSGGILGYYNNTKSTGDNTITIKNSVNYGAITSGSTQSGGGTYPGGIVGAIGGSSANTAYLKAVTISNCANFGAVSGKSYKGSIAGVLRPSNGTAYVLENLYSSAAAEVPAFGEFGKNSNAELLSTFSLNGIYNMGYDTNMVGTLNSNSVSRVECYAKNSTIREVYNLADNEAWVMTYDGVKLKAFKGDSIEVDYSIDSAEDIINLMNAPEAWGGGNFTLTANISLSGLDQSPIGTGGDYKFHGNFDGQNYTISGVNIEYGQGAGLFGTVQHGTIKNLKVKGTVTSTASRAGGIVGAVRSPFTIENCTADVTVSSKYGANGGIIGTLAIYDKNETLTIKGCTFNGTVTGTSYNGGILGYVLVGAEVPQRIVIENCTNNGTVNCTSTGNGGIVGMLSPSVGTTVSITGCKNNGSVTGYSYTGGILGLIDEDANGTSTNENVTYTVTNCENTNKATVTSTSGNGTGGIVGLATVASGCSLTVSGCTNYGAISGPAYNAGIVAYIANLSSGKEVNGASYTITGCKNYGSVETTSGNVAAGILGYYANSASGTVDNTLVVEKSANYGAITVNGGEGQYVGGVIGAIGASHNVTRVNATFSELYNASADLSAKYYRGSVIGALRILASGSYTISDLCGEGASYGLISSIGSTSLDPQDFAVANAHNITGATIVADRGGNNIVYTSAYTPADPASDLVLLAAKDKWVMTLDGPKLKIFTDAADVIDTTKTYTINSADDLITVMNHSAIWSLDFKLAKSIDLTGKEQTPIGTYGGRKFTGTFDGNGKTVSGINIEHGQGAGLFGCIQGASNDHVVIKDLTVSGTVTSTSSRSGGLVGTIASGGAEIYNCTSNIDVTAPSEGALGGIVGTISLENHYSGVDATTIIDGCVNNGAITGTRYNGGILGYVIGSTPNSEIVVSNSKNYGAITNTSSNCAGGIVGYYHMSATEGDNAFLILNCGNYGDITAPANAQFVAGILGGAPSHVNDTYVVDITVSDVYNCGTVTAKAGSTGSIIGLVSSLGGGSYTFENWSDKGEGNVPMIGDISSSELSPVYVIKNAYTVNGTVLPAALDGNTFENVLALDATATTEDKVALAAEDGWVMTSNGPMIEAFTTAEDFEVDYSIDSVEDYLIITASPASWSGDFTLEANLDLKGVATTPIGNSDVAFTGTFDGKNHTISGLNVQGNEAGAGFFGVVSDDGNKTVIKNFTIKGTVTNAEHRFVGGFVGIVCGETELEALINYTTVTSGYFGANAGRIGGIVGGFVNNNLVPAINDVDNDGDYGLTVKNCANYGKIEAKLNTEYVYSDDYNAENVYVRHSQARVGGIIGSITPAYEAAANKGSNTILIEGCRNYGEVKGVVAVGGIAGVAESSKATNNIKITKCSNYGDVYSVYAGGSDVWFGTWTGGIVGYANLSGYEAQYVDSFEVSYCYNEGEVSAPNAHLINSQLAQKFVDEDDIVTDGEGVEDDSTTETTTSSVENRAQVGGIVGYAYGGYGEHVVTIKACYNNGLVWANGNDVAGIVGIANSAHVYDCYNTGVVESTFIDTKAETRTYGRYVGGIIGRLAGDLNKFERNFNKGETVSTGGSGVFGVGGGYNAYPHFYTNNFYYNSLTTKDKNSTKITEAQLGDYSVFTGINESDEWIYTVYGPELKYFHVCENTEKIVTTEADCITNEVYNETCRCLVTVYKTGVVGDIDPDNHAFDKAKWESSGDAYVFACPDCKQVFATAETPAVYVDSYTFINAFVGDDENDGTTPETAVCSIEEAARRLSTTGGKIIICDRYYLGKSGALEVNLPTYEKTVTITTKLGAEGKVVTGFAVATNGVHLNLGGPTKFENIIFNGTSDAKNPSDGGYYKIPVICAGWNDVEFGEGIYSFGAAYFVAGNCYHDSFKVPASVNDAAKTQNLVFSKISAIDITDGNGNLLQNAVTFFSRVYLGDRVRDGALTDTVTTYTVANKTVNATFNRTTVIDLYTAAAISPENINAQMSNIDTTVNINGDAYIRYIHTGDGNTDGSGNGTAYMDKLTVNLNDNARVYGAWAFENIRDLTVNISDENGGRSNDYGVAAKLIVTKSGGYVATGSEKAVVTYGSHSFKKGTAAPAYNAMYNVIETITDDCDWSEEVLNVVTGEYVKTCSFCGKICVTEAPAATELSEDLYKYGISATLANEILLEYLVRLDNEVVVDECYIKVEHYAAGSSVPSVTVVELSSKNIGDTATTYRFYAPGVAAKEMNDRIDITFYAVVDGERYVADTVSKSIVDYYNMAYAAYGEETRGQAPAFMNVLYALFNYGAEAQRYFEYNDGNLVNVVIPADKQMTEFSATATATTEVVDDCADDVYTISAFAPILEDRVNMALAFDLVGEAPASVVFKGSYTDINGAVKTFVTDAAKVIVNENQVIVYVDNVAAKDLRQTVTGALYSGDTQISDSISFSFEAYAAKANAGEANLCAAILNYCDAARELFYKAAE